VPWVSWVSGVGSPVGGEAGILARSWHGKRHCRQSSGVIRWEVRSERKERCITGDRELRPMNDEADLSVMQTTTGNAVTCQICSVPLRNQAKPEWTRLYRNGPEQQHSSGHRSGRANQTIVLVAR